MPFEIVFYQYDYDLYNCANPTADDYDLIYHDNNDVYITIYSKEYIDIEKQLIETFKPQSFKHYMTYRGRGSAVY